ncbi:hypothetical protein [Thermanaerothrix sp.]|uniref:hypothetical protein n=1 Tax=Thermanaerothrix sp. TaxID=2972675 RepID=UPI002ADD5550|nr:hypothetical protein [Thermanaerothrix sp.]
MPAPKGVASGFLIGEVLMRKRKPETKSVIVQFRATKAEADQFKQAAKRRSVTLSKLIRVAISDFLNREVEHERKL